MHVIHCCYAGVFTHIMHQPWAHLCMLSMNNNGGVTHVIHYCYASAYMHIMHYARYMHVCMLSDIVVMNVIHYCYAGARWSRWSWFNSGVESLLCQKISYRFEIAKRLIILWQTTKGLNCCKNRSFGILINDNSLESISLFLTQYNPCNWEQLRATHAMYATHTTNKQASKQCTWSF